VAIITLAPASCSHLSLALVMPPKRKPRSTPDLSATVATTTTTTTSTSTARAAASTSGKATSSAASDLKPYSEYLRCTTGGSNKFYYIIAKGATASLYPRFVDTGSEELIE